MRNCGGREEETGDRRAASPARCAGELEASLGSEVSSRICRMLALIGYILVQNPNSNPLNNQTVDQTIASGSSPPIDKCASAYVRLANYLVTSSNNLLSISLITGSVE